MLTLVETGLGISSVQSLSPVQLFANPWTAACQASLSVTISWSLPKLMSIKSVMPSSHLILYGPLLFPPSVFPSTRIFSSDSALRIRWPKYWSFSFNISPFNPEYSGLISFKIDWFDLVAVQGILKSLLHYHNLKASIGKTATQKLNIKCPLHSDLMSRPDSVPNHPKPRVKKFSHKHGTICLYSFILDISLESKIFRLSKYLP